MAPADVSHESSLLDILLPLVHIERRDAAANGSTLPTSTIAAFAAVIGILSAIILGSHSTPRQSIQPTLIIHRIRYIPSRQMVSRQKPSVDHLPH